MGEMRGFADLTGFDGSDDEWSEEFSYLCLEHVAESGIDFALFENLVNDTSGNGCHCTNDELKDMASEMNRKNRKTRSGHVLESRPRNYLEPPSESLAGG